METQVKNYYIKQIGLSNFNSKGQDVNISIEHATILSKSSDFNDIEQEIANTIETLDNTASDKIDFRNKQLQKLSNLENRKRQFISDFKHLSITINKIEQSQQTERYKKVKTLYDEGKFREANAILSTNELKTETENSIRDFENGKTNLENIANDYIIKANLTLLDQSIANNFVAARDCFEQAIKTSELINSPATYERINQYAIVLYAYNCFNDALEKYKQIHAFLLKNNSSEDVNLDIAYTTMYLGKLYAKTRRFDLAKLYFDESLVLYKKLAIQDPQTHLYRLLELYMDINKSLVAGRNFKDISKYNEEKLIMIDECTRNKNVDIPVEDLCYILLEMSDINLELEYYDEAIKNSEKILTQFKFLKDENGNVNRALFAAAFSNLAFAKIKKKQFSEASEVLGFSLNLCRELLKDNPNVHIEKYAETIFRRGLLNYEMKHYSEALDNFSESLKLLTPLFEQDQDAYFTSYCIAMEYSAYTQFHNKEYEKAIISLNKVIELYSELPPESQAVYFSNLVVLHDHLVKIYKERLWWKEAEEHIEKVIKYFEDERTYKSTLATRSYLSSIFAYIWILKHVKKDIQQSASIAAKYIDIIRENPTLNDAFSLEEVEEIKKEMYAIIND